MLPIECTAYVMHFEEDRGVKIKAVSVELKCECKVSVLIDMVDLL